MKRLIYADDASFDTINKIHKEYREYLTSIRADLPPNVFDFAASEWHYDPLDQRCLHDCGLIRFEMVEIEDSKRDLTATEIIIELLSSDKRLITLLRYKDVKYYSFAKGKIDGVLASVLKQPPTYHGDWLIDEIYLSDDGFVTHEIEFSFNAQWKIVFSDLECQTKQN